MEEMKDAPYCTGNTVCDALRYLGDASYAVLPRDVAHQVGEFKKNLLGGMRWLLEKEMKWIDERVKGGDRLREEWRRGTGASENVGSGI
jgi:hypothetical protein